LLVIGLLLVVLPGAFVAICFGWLYPVYVVERPGIGAGLLRCTEITLRHFWFSLALMVATTGIILAAGFAEDAARVAIDLVELSPIPLWLASTLVGLPTYFVGACTWVVTTAALLRIREEEGASAPVETLPE
jgi:hypothetical protein